MKGRKPLQRAMNILCSNLPNDDNFKKTGRDFALKITNSKENFVLPIERKN